MPRDYAGEFREDLKEFHEMTKKFYQKEVNIAEYKRFSGGFGSYAQRGGGSSMLRLRFAGGEITKECLLFIAESIEKYSISLVHFSTCQSVQFHNLSEAQVCALIEESFQHGIVTRGGGGNYPRNVMCSPLSGVQEGEYFDVLPYAKAAEDALYVIENTQALTDIDFSTLFDVEANNGPESILAIQCAVQGYSYGNARNVAWSRSSVIADQTWGAGKGPTLSLQKMYDLNDKRRMWTYMTNGDYYPMLNRAGGGYTYNYVSRDDSGDVLEDKNEMLAHIKKYIIGKGADCNGNVGINQDAANNIYLMRLADVYLTYVEAKMGTASSTSDPTAMKYYNMVRQRAGVTEASSVTYVELLKERRREFAFESQTWFDTQRYRYREGDAAALELLNNGYGTGLNRAAMYIGDYENNPTIDKTNENDLSVYKIVDNTADGGQYDNINLSVSSFVAPIPAAVTSTSPALLGAPVSYYGD